MEIINTGFEGLYIIKPKIFNDSRGYFFESYNSSNFEKENIIFNPVQDNESCSTKGVIRGLHYQLAPHAQTKLIRVVNGKIYDAVVDLRRYSATYLKWFGVEIDSDNKIQFMIPKGFAHGFSVLSDTAIIQYKVDDYYHKESERGIIYNDTTLQIDWKLGDIKPIISEKDMKHPSLDNADYNF